MIASLSEKKKSYMFTRGPKLQALTVVYEAGLLNQKLFNFNNPNTYDWLIFYDI
jgi:hypothetical protein